MEKCCNEYSLPFVICFFSFILNKSKVFFAICFCFRFCFAVEWFFVPNIPFTKFTLILNTNAVTEWKWQPNTKNTNKGWKTTRATTKNYYIQNSFRFVVFAIVADWFLNYNLNIILWSTEFRLVTLIGWNKMAENCYRWHKHKTSTPN